MSKSFEYYDNWRNEIVECPKCGWKGRVQDGAQREFRELFDYCCPHCVQNVILAVVSYPTVEQIRQAARDGNAEAIRELPRVAYTESRTQRFAREKLRSPNELPDIGGGKRFDVLLDTHEMHLRSPSEEAYTEYSGRRECGATIVLAGNRNSTLPSPRHLFPTPKC
jgi:hypothetical protein